MATPTLLKTISTTRCFDGWLRKYSHESKAIQGVMQFNVFTTATSSSSGTLYYLSGLTCTEDNAPQKSHILYWAHRYNLSVVFPDTSPRDCSFPGDTDSYDFGKGAGFYVNATQQPWAAHYRMYEYVGEELPALLQNELGLSSRKSVLGHSMGGHGALVLFLRNPGQYVSCSAWAPICHPSQCPWGQKAFRGYLGDEAEKWASYDATRLMERYEGGSLGPILIDQGLEDKFYLEKQLLPEDLVEAAKDKVGVSLEMRFQPEYDHSYYFVASFMEAHIRHHAKAMGLTSN